MMALGFEVQGTNLFTKSHILYVKDHQILILANQKNLPQKWTAVIKFDVICYVLTT